MRRLLLPILLLALASFSGRPIANTVTMPLEVIGADSTTVTITLNVTQAPDSLRLDAHNLSYHYTQTYTHDGTFTPINGVAETIELDTKAQFRVNGGAWQPISNATVTCLEPYKSLQCLAGPLGNKTLKLRVAAGPGWIVGDNTVEFLFRGTEGVTSGYRILKIDPEVSHVSVLGATSFVEDDPDTWTPPLTIGDSADTLLVNTRGHTLFNQRDLLLHSDLSANERYAGSPAEDFAIHAACADCHASNARDLAFFNFSNKSIEARTLFHLRNNAAISSADAQAIADTIASWIRMGATKQIRDTLAAYGYTMADAGRPWNPPYQPGPGLHARPGILWAAGAGYGCVLANDETTAKFMFPDAASKAILDAITDPVADCDVLANSLTMETDAQKMLAFVHPDSSMNDREIPVEAEWPDIMEWWPDIHPVDYWTPALADAFPYFVNARSLTSQLAAAGGRQNMIDVNRQRVGLIGGTVRLDQLVGEIDRYPYVSDGSVPDNATYPFSKSPIVQYSNAQSILIRLWEIMHTYSLECLGDYIYNTTPLKTNGVSGERADRLKKVANCTWLGSQIIYDMAPHKNSKPADPEKGPFVSEDARQYWSDVWYDEALVLNGGNRQSPANDPFDFNYDRDHTINTGNKIQNRTVGVRLMRHFYKMEEVTNNFFGYTSAMDRDYQSSWPQRIHTTTLQKLEVGKSKTNFDMMTPSLRAKLFEVAALVWQAATSEYPTSSWRLCSQHNDNNCVPDPSYTPLSNATIVDQGNRADQLYSLLVVWDNYGVPSSALTPIANWGKTMWPNAVWTNYASLSSSGIVANSYRMEDLTGAVSGSGSGSIKPRNAGTDPDTLFAKGSGRHDAYGARIACTKCQAYEASVSFSVQGADSVDGRPYSEAYVALMPTNTPGGKQVRVAVTRQGRVTMLVDASGSGTYTQVGTPVYVYRVRGATLRLEYNKSTFAITGKVKPASSLTFTTLGTTTMNLGQNPDAGTFAASRDASRSVTALVQNVSMETDP